MKQFKVGERALYKFKACATANIEYVDIEILGVGKKTYKVKMPNGDIKHALIFNIVKDSPVVRV